MKNPTFLLCAALLLTGALSLPEVVTARPHAVVLTKRLPTPEAAEAYGSGREAARAWLAGWRARGSDATEYNNEYQQALADEQSAETNSLDYYYAFGYRTGLVAYK